MTLLSGHPIVIVDGTRYDGDVDCADDGLRAYLKDAFKLPDDAIEDCNGSELHLDGKPVVGHTISGTFYLYWGGQGCAIIEAHFTLSGNVELDEDGATVLRVNPAGGFSLQELVEEAMSGNRKEASGE